MAYKVFVSMTIAVIGSGRTAKTWAQGLACAGHEIFLGLKDDEKLPANFLTKGCDNIYTTSIEDAAERADLIVVATTPEDVREAAYLLNDVRKKVILDLSYMSYTEAPSYRNTLSAIKAITGSQLVVKCFNAAGFELTPPVAGKDNCINMFIAGDSKKAKEIARLISLDLNFGDCHDFGGSDAAPLLDEMAICYHHIALRKTPGEKISIRITKSK